MKTALLLAASHFSSATCSAALASGLELLSCGHCGPRRGFLRGADNKAGPTVLLSLPTSCASSLRRIAALATMTILLRAVSGAKLGRATERGLSEHGACRLGCLRPVPPGAYHDATLARGPSHCPVRLFVASSDRRTLSREGSESENKSPSLLPRRWALLELLTGSRPSIP